MTMTDLVGELTTLLRAGTTSNVEQYWRDTPPEALTAYVQPKSMSGEGGVDLNSGVSGGTYFIRYNVDIVCEGPWKDEVGTYTDLDGLVEEIFTVIRANRDITHSGAANCTNGRLEGVQYVYAQRPSTAAKTTWVGIVTASWRTGSS